MVYNTENGAPHFRNQFNRKKRLLQWILLLEIEKKDIKTLNNFQKLLKQISQSSQYNQRAGGRAKKAAVRQRKCLLSMRKLPKTIDISGNQKYILVPYVNNPSEETIFGSNKIKEQCGTMKLQNEEVSLAQKHLKP